MLRGERGSTTLELVIWGPVLLLVLSVIVYAGRTAQARQTVEAAAGEAARAATAAPTQRQARADATAAAEAALQSSGLRCRTTSVEIDTRGWMLPAGVPATATAVVSCDVDLASITAPGVPGSQLVQGTASSAMDTFRARS